MADHHSCLLFCFSFPFYTSLFSCPESSSLSVDLIALATETRTINITISTSIMFAQFASTQYSLTSLRRQCALFTESVIWPQAGQQDMHTNWANLGSPWGSVSIKAHTHTHRQFLVESSGQHSRTAQTHRRTAMASSRISAFLFFFSILVSSSSSVNTDAFLATTFLLHSITQTHTRTHHLDKLIIARSL